MSVKRFLQLLAFPLVGIALIAVVQAQAWRLHLDQPSVDKAALVGFILLGAVLCHRLFCSLALDCFVAGVKGRPVPNILKHLIAIGVGTVALMAAINVLFTVSVSGILTLSSVIGVVVGLALRPIILDVFSGLSANLDTAFKIGDWIELSGEPDGRAYAGWVEEVNWRTTHIRTRSGDMIICPNSIISTVIISNLSRPFPLSQFEVSVKLPPDLDSARAFRVLQAAVDSTLDSEHGPSSDKRPDVLIKAIQESGVEYLVRFWLDASKHDAAEVKHEVLTSVHRHLLLAGVPLADAVILNLDRRETSDPASFAGRTAVLSRIELFGGIGDKGIRRLAEGLAARNFEPGELLVVQGEDGNDMFVIVEGAVEVLVNVDGGEIAVDRMQAGDYFGEMSLLTDEPRSASIRGLTRGIVYQIGRDAIASLIDSDAGLMELLSRNLADRNLNRFSKIEAAREGVPEITRKGLASALLAKMKGVFHLG